MSAQVLDAVQRWADDDLRSVNAQIEYLLREALRPSTRPLPPNEEEYEESYRFPAGGVRLSFDLPVSPSAFLSRNSIWPFRLRRSSSAQR